MNEPTTNTPDDTAEKKQAMGPRFRHENSDRSSLYGVRRGTGFGGKRRPVRR